MMKTLLLITLCISATLSMKLKDYTTETTTILPGTIPTTETIITTEPTSDNILEVYKNAGLGKYIVDGDQMSLYMFELEHIGYSFTANDFKISCYETCAANWPPLLLDSEDEALTVGAGIDFSLLGKRKRDDGEWQATYNNIPLYYYDKDITVGDINGHFVNADGGFWYLINPQGLPIKQKLI